jgi:hypothetical protein
MKRFRRRSLRVLGCSDTCVGTFGTLRASYGGIFVYAIGATFAFERVQIREKQNSKGSLPTSWCIDWNDNDLFNAHSDGLHVCFRIWSDALLDYVPIKPGIVDTNLSAILFAWNSAARVGCRWGHDFLVLR